MGPRGLRRLHQQSAVKKPVRLPSVREYRLLTFEQRQQVMLELDVIRLAFLMTEEIKPLRGNDEHTR